MNRQFIRDAQQTLPSPREHEAMVPLNYRVARPLAGLGLTWLALGWALAGCQATPPGFELSAAGAAGSGWSAALNPQTPGSAPADGVAGSSWGSGTGTGLRPPTGSTPGARAADSGSGGGPSLPPPAQGSTELSPAQPQLKDWYLSCSNYPEKDPYQECSAVDSLSVDELLEAVALDLEAAQASARPFLRYFSLSQSLNSECDRCSRAVRQQRFALTQFVNSLSLGAEPIPPRPLDERAAVYAIDLRDYSWERPVEVEGQRFPDAWEALAAHTESAYAYAGPEAERIRAWALSPLAVLHLPPAMVAGIQHPLYPALLRLPRELDTFMEAALGYPPEPGMEKRAAFDSSGVSLQERLIERWEGADGTGLWRAVDFRPDTDKPSLLAEPLSSAGDQSQVIFTLPNGLLGFSVFDASGTMIGEDPLVPDVVNAVGRTYSPGSCFSCHSRGIIPFRDRVLPFAQANPEAFSSATMRSIEERYLPQRQFDSIVKQEERRYTGALQLAGVPPSYLNYIGRLRFEYLESMDRTRLAGELMVTEAAFSENLEAIPLALRRDTVRRPILNQHYLEAYCALHAGDRNQLEACAD